VKIENMQWAIRQVLDVLYPIVNNPRRGTDDHRHLDLAVRILEDYLYEGRKK